MNINCTICGSRARWCENKEVYGKNYGESYMIWLCTNEECGAYVGCHQNTRQPLGTFADKETKQWRMKAHELIDPLWQSKKYTRKYIYRQLGLAFGKSIHIGQSDINTCKEIIETAKLIFTN